MSVVVLILVGWFVCSALFAAGRAVLTWLFERSADPVRTGRTIECELWFQSLTDHYSRLWRETTPDCDRDAATRVRAYTDRAAREDHEVALLDEWWELPAHDPRARS